MASTARSASTSSRRYTSTPASHPPPVARGRSDTPGGRGHGARDRARHGVMRDPRPCAAWALRGVGHARYGPSAPSPTHLASRLPPWHTRCPFPFGKGASTAGGANTMKRWIAVPIAVGLCASVTGCRLERSDETMREDRAEIAEERRRTREEIIEDHRDLMERIHSLPPEERMRLHEEM